jgi:hypothetical protein
MSSLLYFMAALAYLFVGIKAVSHQEAAEVTG